MAVEEPKGKVVKCYRTLSIIVQDSGDLEIPQGEDKFSVLEIREVLRELLEHLGIKTSR